MTAYTLSEVAYQPVKQSLLAQIAPEDARGRYAAVRSFWRRYQPGEMF